MESFWQVAAKAVETAQLASGIAGSTVCSACQMLFCSTNIFTPLSKLETADRPT